MDKRSNNIVRRILRVLFYSMSAILLLLAILITILLIKKDNFGKSLLLETNSHISGELLIEDVELSLFAQFPNVSFTLVGFTLFENPEIGRDSMEKPVANISQIYVALNIRDLLRNNINIDKARVERGEIFLNQYHDGTLNIMNTLKARADSLPTVEIKAPDNDMVFDIGIKLDRLIFENVQFTFQNLEEGSSVSLNIKEIKSSASYLSDSIQCKLSTQIGLNALIYTNQFSLDHTALALTTEFSYHTREQTINILPSKLGVGKASFSILGDLELAGNQMVNLLIDGYDSDLSVSKFLLTQAGIDNILSGDLRFEGSVRGSMKDAIPEIDVSLICEEMEISIPDSPHNIEKLNLRGLFSSGPKKDFSEAILKVDTLRAILPGGYINTSFEIQNFQIPSLSYICDLKSDVEGFDRVFQLNFLKDLKGKLAFKDRYSGTFIPGEGWINRAEGVMELSLDSFSFQIPDVIEVDLLQGKLSGLVDSISISDLVLHTGNTDIYAAGLFHNLSDFFFDREKKIVAELYLESEVFDLPEFLKFDPKIGESFPYKILNNKIHLEASTTHDKFFNFHVVPEILFSFEALEAGIKDLLPPIAMSGGDFNLGEIQEKLFLDFKGFEINIADGFLQTDFQFYDYGENLDSLYIGLESDQLNPGKLLYFKEYDTIPALLDSQIDGEFSCHIIIPGGSDLLFKNFDLDVKSLFYHNGKDTLASEHIELKGREIGYVKSSGSNFFESLSARMSISSSGIVNPYLPLDKILLDIEASGGVYNVNLAGDQLFGETGSGKVLLSPFTEPPHYELNYKIDNFSIAKLQESFNTPPYFSGLADFEVDMGFSGDDEESILSSLNGSVNVRGENLVLLGADLDEIISNFERSQQFTLIDIGAIAIAGPTALAITKGGDYANILISGMGDTTRISMINSTIVMEGGKVIFDDVAFATNRQRVAAMGYYDLSTDSIDFRVYVLDKKGCSLIEQALMGSLDDPEQSKIGIIKTLLGPIKNLLQDAEMINCDVVYEGVVYHPESKE